MKNSRKDGKMIVHCKKSYKMAVDGQQSEQNRVICKDITYEAEYIAFDLEQYLNVALFNMPVREEFKKLPKTSDDDMKAEKFYKNECPSIKEVEEQANMFQIMISMNKEIQLSRIVETFEGIVRSKLIHMEGDIPMPYEIWKTLDRNDRIKIMFCYIAFFVNPLQRLQSLSTEMEKSQLQGVNVKI